MNGESKVSFSGAISTILWGFFAAIGARVGWGIVGFIIDMIARAVHNT